MQIKRKHQYLSVRKNLEKSQLSFIIHFVWCWWHWDEKAEKTTAAARDVPHCVQLWSGQPRLPNHIFHSLQWQHTLELCVCLCLSTLYEAYWIIHDVCPKTPLRLLWSSKKLHFPFLCSYFWLKDKLKCRGCQLKFRDLQITDEHVTNGILVLTMNFRFGIFLNGTQALWVHIWWHIWWIMSQASAEIQLVFFFSQFFHVVLHQSESCAGNVPVNVSSHPEISNFGHTPWSFRSQEAIPRCNVPERWEEHINTFRSLHILHRLMKTHHFNPLFINYDTFSQDFFPKCLYSSLGKEKNNWTFTNTFFDVSSYIIICPRGEKNLSI